MFDATWSTPSTADWQRGNGRCGLPSRTKSFGDAAERTRLLAASSAANPLIAAVTYSCPVAERNDRRRSASDDEASNCRVLFCDAEKTTRERTTLLDSSRVESGRVGRLE